MRLSKEELEQIKIENNVDTLWSWSRVSSWWTSHYEWFLNYVKHEPADRNDCIYGTVGNIAHDTLEKFYQNEIQYADLISEFETGWDVSRNVLELKFDRNNQEQDTKIGDRYYANLQEFFKHHQPIPHQLHTEEFAKIKIGNNILQGYIDAWYQNETGDYYITDWKTSSMYKGDVLIEKSGQLVCYAISFLQSGIPLNKIHAQFNFLKYCNIVYEQANGNIKTMSVERRLLGEKLQSPCKMWLKKFGYEPDKYLMTILDKADISCLPLEVQDKITIKDCYVEVPLTKDLIKHWHDLVNDTIAEIEGKICEYNITGDESIFYDSIEDVEKESYYFATLSEYSANKNICYKKYLENLEKCIDIYL